MSVVSRGDIEDPNDRLFETPRGSPERDLLCSILERAVVDLKGDDQEARRSAHLWIFREDCYSTPLPFSFYWCMQMLGWHSCVPLFRIKCREVIRLKAELGSDVNIFPTSNFESIFKVEARVYERKKKEKV